MFVKNNLYIDCSKSFVHVKNIQLILCFVKNKITVVTYTIYIIFSIFMSLFKKNKTLG